NFNPLWLGGQLYFLSDRNDKQFNVHRFDPASGATVQVSRETQWDVRALGGHGSTIVYEAGGRLKRLELDSGDLSEIIIEIAPDLPQKQPQWKNAAQTITGAQISRSGKRAAITARGEVFTVPVDDGSTRNLSRTGSLREYDALWSPDGLKLAWISETGSGMSKSQEVVISDQAGNVEKRFPLGPHFYDLRAWAVGDAPRLVFTDNHLGLNAINLDSGKITTIAREARRDDIHVAVSPDGRWLAFALEQPNYHRELRLYEFSSGRSHRVGDNMAEVLAPAFSPDGQYLFFAASTNAGPLQVGLNMTSQERPFRAGLYAAVLSSESASPLAPRSGDEEAAGTDQEAQEESENGDSSDTAVTRVDVDGLGDRIVALPVAERFYNRIGVGKDGDLFYTDFVQPGASEEPPGSNGNDANRLKRFDFEDREESTLLHGVTDFAISSDGAHMIIRKSSGSLATAEISDDMDPQTLDLGGVRVFVDPAKEWAQIFDEAWRMEKEYFYAENMHGLDWEAMYRKYQPLLPHAGRREDVNEILVEMIAEMQAGHNRVGGGDVYSDDEVDVGLLGANLEIHDGRYRIARVYTGESWNPFVDAPLAQPGNEAFEGEYILAVNGRNLT
ncbi:MAG: PDZ domain-containing protein, partial [Xanthomonadales bacterium]|nr:PDZ domain-containing protein [Xanthomonadales bacterium]